jgi:uracil-DNA glycosylase
MTWNEILAEQKQSEYFINIIQHIDERRRVAQVYPANHQIFAALSRTKLESLKVVILGQDPYHGPGQANGLAFSVPSGQSLPPSLKNIFTELESDIGTNRTSGDLSDWAGQGVLLLNTSLTVEKGAPGSHSGIGWHKFTDAIISSVSDTMPHVVFVLWGNHARSKKPLIDPRHTIVESVHPSPLSAYGGFFGSRPFSKTNSALSVHGQSPIIW